jgi:hypothetical protein
MLSILKPILIGTPKIPKQLLRSSRCWYHWEIDNYIILLWKNAPKHASTVL